MQFSGQYAGDIDVRQAHERLKGSDTAVLVDVRTKAEWNFVGVPDLREIGQQPVFVEWQSFPPAAPVTDFAAQLNSELEQRGVTKDAEIFFLCRSGARSQSAAIAMTQAGYSRCFNVAGGFEGPLDDKAHRGGLSGWKAEGLPWAQN